MEEEEFIIIDGRTDLPVMIDNEVMEDSRLSFTAKGVYAVCMATFRGKAFSDEEVFALSKVTPRKATEQALAELYRYGYLGE